MAYRRRMDPCNAAKMFRENANIYLKMIEYVPNEQQRRILHELFEENEARAEFFETKVRRNLRELADALD